MFLTGPNCLFGTLVAVCDPALELHAHSRSVREVFQINNFAPSKTWHILPSKTWHILP